MRAEKYGKKWLWRAAKSYTVAGFEKAMDAILDKQPAAHCYLSKIPPETLAFVMFQPRRV